MDHKANWKEIEAAYVELANCVCNTDGSMPCLHCEPEAFKVWYQMRFGKSAFSNTFEFSGLCNYYPIDKLDFSLRDYLSKINLPYSIRYSKKEKAWLLDGSHFKTVKEAVIYWMQEIKSDEPQS